MKLNDHYNDRGVKKYMGFFLAEHTSRTKHEAAINAKFNPGKERMSPEQITDIIQHAILKDLIIGIQLDYTLGDDHGFPDDIVGKVRAYDERRLWLFGTKIEIYFGMIRHVEIVNRKKWYEE